MSDAKIAAIGRQLAVALARWGYERRPEYQKEILQLNTDLCAAVSIEAAERKQQAQQQPEQPT